MIGLDTNIVLRWLVADGNDAAQNRVALRAIDQAEDTIFLNDIVIAETGWVLAARYQLSRREIAAGFQRLLQHPLVRFTNATAVLSALGSHKDLGVHSEMFSDGLIDLVEAGVVTGRLKRIHPGKIVATFVLGSKRLYDFVDDNPLVAMLDVGYVNDSNVIRRNPKVTAINSAIEVDITGQVCADSIGTKFYSGVGGQMDYMRGAAQSEGGKPIIALPSITKNGESRITVTLKVGAGVVTTRAHVHYVVTEFGSANLHGKNLRQRAKSLIEIAHPDHRERLSKEAFELFGF